MHSTISRDCREPPWYDIFLVRRIRYFPMAKNWYRFWKKLNRMTWSLNNCDITSELWTRKWNQIGRFIISISGKFAVFGNTFCAHTNTAELSISLVSNTPASRAKGNGSRTVHIVIDYIALLSLQTRYHPVRSSTLILKQFIAWKVGCYKFQLRAIASRHNK